MNISRKCPDCQMWNTNVTHCSNCGAILDPHLQLKRENELREEAVRNRTKDKVDLFLEHFKTSRWWLVKGLYYVLYSVWFLLFTIVSFFIYMVAAGPG